MAQDFMAYSHSHLSHCGTHIVPNDHITYKSRPIRSFLPLDLGENNVTLNGAHSGYLRTLSGSLFSLGLDTDSAGSGAFTAAARCWA